MKLLKLTDLIIPDNRQRKEFPVKEMEDLKESITTKGLLHLPVVRNDGLTLVAGERRCRAIKELSAEGVDFLYNDEAVPIGYVPVSLLSDLDPLEVMEAELEENTIRLDLSWQDKARALLQLNELRLAQATAEGRIHTAVDLQEEVRGTRNGAQGIRESLILAENLDRPEVASAKTQKEAVKALRKIKETEHRAELAGKVNLRGIKHDLRLGSMVDLMPTLPDSYFDLIITDPPYGVDADTFGDMASTGHNYKDTWEVARALYRITATEGFRVAKTEAHAYAFCTFEHFAEVQAEFDLAGWTVWPRPIIWNKGNGMLPRPDHGPRYTYESILFASKGDKRTLLVRPDVITMSGVAKLLHGAQKPVDLYIDLISRSCLPGAKILDPFGGSGTAISAATATRCEVTLFELGKENFDICLGRLNEDALDQIELEV